MKPKRVRMLCASLVALLAMLQGAIQAPLAAAETDVAMAPDLSGVWTNSSLTGLSRPSNIENLVLTPAEADALAGNHYHNKRLAKDQQKSDPNRGAPPVVERLPGVGNYSANWVDPGSTYALVNGEIRSSWIVHPADGRLPLKDSVKERLGTLRAVRNGLAGPEVRAPGERCLIGFGGTGGPPMLNVLYNNFYRILQTPTHVVILVEMVHDARIIPIIGPLVEGDFEPARDARWLGTSVGRYDGNELVITTSGFHPARAQSGPVPLSSGAVVEERLRRVDPATVLYRFRVEDPEHYTEPVLGEMTFKKRDVRVYEYACHEGNYAMPAMLKGARLLERERVD